MRTRRHPLLQLSMRIYSAITLQRLRLLLGRPRAPEEVVLALIIVVTRELIQTRAHHNLHTQAISPGRYQPDIPHNPHSPVPQPPRVIHMRAPHSRPLQLTPTQQASSRKVARVQILWMQGNWKAPGLNIEAVDFEGEASLIVRFDRIPRNTKLGQACSRR